MLPRAKATVRSWVPQRESPKAEALAKMSHGALSCAAQLSRPPAPVAHPQTRPSACMGAPTSAPRCIWSVFGVSSLPLGTCWAQGTPVCGGGQQWRVSRIGLIPNPVYYTGLG